MSSQRDGKQDSANVTADPATIYRDAKPGASSTAATAPVDAALSTKGSGMAHSSGATFHDDSTSHAAADALGANAFTAGNDVYFGAGQLAPSTPAGDKLIQHELTHVDQSRGVQSPEPGNFRVSSHDDAAEVAARGSGGGEGSASTIYRDEKNPNAQAPAGGGTGPAANHTPSAGGANANAGGANANAGGSADAYEAFKSAITSHDRAGALDKWSKLTTEQQARLGGESDIFHHIVAWTLHKDAPKVIKAGNIPLDIGMVYAIFNDAEFEQWLPEMRAQGLLTPFLLAEPKKETVARSIAQKLKTWIDAAANLTEAKAIFQKVYPTLLDTAQLDDDDANSGVSVVAWSSVAQVAHLFDTLVNFLPVGHVQTIQGFFLMTTTDSGPHTGHVWGWFDNDTHQIALPLHGGTASHDQDISDHGDSDMTGGSNSGAPGAYTKPDGTAGANQQMGHFEGTVLHEVGHGVGQRMGGNAYALEPGSWPGWTPIGPFLFEMAMWESPTGTGDTSVDEAAQHIDGGQAAQFMMSELKSGRPNGKIDRGWFHSDPTRDDIVKWLTTRYSNVPLQKWWKKVIVDGTSEDDVYSWEDPVRLKDGWAYGILTRADNKFMKFKQEAYQKKVSWYGISSPYEWWAEQYAHYYRTEKTGGGLIDSTTKDMLDRLDSQAWAPTNSDGSHGVQYPTVLNHGSGNGGGTGAGGGIAGAGGQTAGQQTPPPANRHRKEPLFFPW